MLLEDISNGILRARQDFSANLIPIVAKMTKGTDESSYNGYSWQYALAIFSNDRLSSDSVFGTAPDSNVKSYNNIKAMCTWEFAAINQKEIGYLQKYFDLDCNSIALICLLYERVERLTTAVHVEIDNIGRERSRAAEKSIDRIIDLPVRESIAGVYAITGLLGDSSPYN